MSPTLEKVHDSNQKLLVIGANQQKIMSQIKELEYTVFAKGERLSVFDKIDQRIAKNENKRIGSELKIQ